MKEYEIKCANCGATSGADFVTQNVWRCRFCGAEFALENDQAQRRAAEEAAFRAQPEVQQFLSARTARRSSEANVRWMIILACLVVLFGCFVAAIVFTHMDNEEEKADKASEARYEARHQPHATASTPQLSATFRYDRTVPSESDQYVLGEVQNTSKAPIGAAKVYVIMKNAQGKEIASSSDYTEAEYIEPGQRVPIRVLVKKPPHYSKLAFDVSTSTPLSSDKPVRGLRLDKLPPRIGSYGQWVFSGKVDNKGTTTAEFVKIEIAALDAQGRLLGDCSSFADGEKLAPGASTRYEVTTVSFPAHPHPAKFKYWVWSMRK